MWERSNDILKHQNSQNQKIIWILFQLIIFSKFYSGSFFFFLILNTLLCKGYTNAVRYCTKAMKHGYVNILVKSYMICTDTLRYGTNTYRKSIRNYLFKSLINKFWYSSDTLRTLSSFFVPFISHFFCNLVMSENLCYMFGFC